ncbi:unnamed protein product, partial [Polarella glacialis]
AHDAMVAFGSMSHMLIWFGIAEGFGMLAITNMLEGKTDRQPGDFGLRTLYPSDATGQREMQLKELRNGRLAMLAYGGIATMAVLTEGEKWPFFATKEDKKTSGGSTLCGGVTSAGPPAQRLARPFLPKPANLEGLAGNEEFDPLELPSCEQCCWELSTTWDVRWMQEAELKHGRVCMLAVLGFVTEPMLTFPGMTSAPDATQAVYTAPIPAMAALLFIAGSIESNAYNGKINMLDMFEGEGAKRQPGDLNFGKQFLPKDKAAEMDIRTKELANGRLAMLAIGGMIHHNIVVNGPLFPLIPDGWLDRPCQYYWKHPFCRGFDREGLRNLSQTAELCGALGALGTVAMMSAPAVQQAFLAPSVSGPSSSSALRGAVTGTGAALPEASSSDNRAAACTALGTAAVAAAAMASGRRVTNTRRAVKVQQLASATGNVATKPFAGGLIGGESGLSSGDFNFDPLGLSVKCEKYLPYFREAELKLAWIGLVAPEFVRLPGPAFCFGAKNVVVEAHNACAVHDLETFFTGTADFIGTQHEVGPLFQMFYVCGFIEFCNISNKAAGLSLENAGDYKLGVQFLPKDEQKVKEMKLKELKNGRLAMLAFGGAITQASITGTGFPWLFNATGKQCQGAGLSSSLLTGSSGSTAARRGQVARKASLAEESGYTMSKAVPFLPMSPALEGMAGEEEGFDPLGMSLAIDIRWLREAELKHARVAMLATAGWIATDLGM